MRTGGPEARRPSLLEEADASMVAEPVSLEQTPHRARRQRVRRIGTVTLGAAAVIVLVVGVAMGLLRPSVELFTPAADPAEALWGRTFFSVSAIEDGQPRPLAPGTRISLTFASDDDIEGDLDALRESYESWESDLPWEDGNGYMFWDVGCNDHSRRVAITAEGIRTGSGFSTASGCRDEVSEQKSWVGGLLGSEPAWELEGDRLVLTSGDDVIVLAEDRLPLTVDEFRERWNANALEGGYPDLVVSPEEPLNRELSPRGRDGQPAVMRAGSVNGDETMIEAYIAVTDLEPDPDDPETWTGNRGDEAVRTAAFRVLVRTVSPELGWQEVEDLLDELGIAGDDQELRHSEGADARTAVRGDVRWGGGGYMLLARPVTADFVWPKW